MDLPGMRLIGIIELMPGSFHLAANGNLPQESYGPELFAVINDFEFSLVKMLAVGCEKTNKALGAGFQD